MVERKEVEALLAYVEMKLESDKVELPPSVSDATLAALCRAWLAVDGAVEARLDIERNDIDDSDMVEIVTDPDTVRHLLYQRVRIVKEGEW